MMAINMNGLKWIWLACLLEGGTLILLVCVAVPIKYGMGYPALTSFMGPIHGLAFLFYIWLLMRTSSERNWLAGDTAKLFVMAMVPFGVLISERFFRRQAASLSATM
ncbi:MAG: DUF3817 domain-containing protein [Sneathiella sp.]